MKALFSEEYYRKYWESFLEPVPGNDYINLESELKKTMKHYENAELPQNAIDMIVKIEAEKIAAKCEKLVYSQMKRVKDILDGNASFGMVTEWQEIEQRAELRKRFEFNCLQLRDFRKKYNL